MNRSTVEKAIERTMRELAAEFQMPDYRDSLLHYLHLLTELLAHYPKEEGAKICPFDGMQCFVRCKDDCIMQRMDSSYCRSCNKINPR